MQLPKHAQTNETFFCAIGLKKGMMRAISGVSACFIVSRSTAYFLFFVFSKGMNPKRLFIPLFPCVSLHQSSNMTAYFGIMTLLEGQVNTTCAFTATTDYFSDPLKHGLIYYLPN